MAMATNKQSSTPSFLNFLKEGLLLPSRNWSLFAAVYVLIVASDSFFLLANVLTVQPINTEIQLDIKVLNGTNPRSPDYAKLLKEMNGARAANILFAAAVDSGVQIVVLFATVATHSGDMYTFGALLGKAKTQLKGPLLTLALFYVLMGASTVLLDAMDTFLMVKQYSVLMLLVSPILVVAAIFILYLSFVCALSVVVAVAESGCHSVSAVGRARRLMRGKWWRAVLFVAVTSYALEAAVSPVRKFASRWMPESVAAELRLDLVYDILMGAAVELFAVCAITAFYYECKESEEVMATNEYVKVSTKDSIV